jgi:hypothetical protein
MVDEMLKIIKIVSLEQGHDTTVLTGNLPVHAAPIPRADRNRGPQLEVLVIPQGHRVNGQTLLADVECMLGVLPQNEPQLTRASRVVVEGVEHRAGEVVDLASPPRGVEDMLQMRSGVEIAGARGLRVGLGGIIEGANLAWVKTALERGVLDVIEVAAATGGEPELALRHDPDNLPVEEGALTDGQVRVCLHSVEKVSSCGCVA